MGLLSITCLVVAESKFLFIHEVQCLREPCINKLDTFSNFLLLEKGDNVKLLSERIYAKKMKPLKKAGKEVDRLETVQLVTSM